MDKKTAQETEIREDGKRYIKYDWYPKSLPWNLVMDDMVYLDSTYSFACFHSEIPAAFELGYASGNYLHSHFLIGERGTLKVGKYVILEATNILANENITIGDHCMFSWGSYITDTWLDENTFSSHKRKEVLTTLAHSKNRYLDLPGPRPVIIEDNVWVGFDAVILPGVRLGRGCVIGCKTIINTDVPPYAVIAGNPARIVKYFKPDDTDEERNKALEKYRHHQ